MNSHTETSRTKPRQPFEGRGLRLGVIEPSWAVLCSVVVLVPLCFFVSSLLPHDVSIWG